MKLFLVRLYCLYNNSAASCELEQESIISCPIYRLQPPPRRRRQQQIQLQLKHILAIKTNVYRRHQQQQQHQMEIPRKTRKRQ